MWKIRSLIRGSRLVCRGRGTAAPGRTVLPPPTGCQPLSFDGCPRARAYCAWEGQGPRPADQPRSSRIDEARRAAADRRRLGGDVEAGPLEHGAGPDVGARVADAPAGRSGRVDGVALDGRGPGGPGVLDGGRQQGARQRRDRARRERRRSRRSTTGQARPRAGSPASARSARTRGGVARPTQPIARPSSSATRPGGGPASTVAAAARGWRPASPRRSPSSGRARRCTSRTGVSGPPRCANRSASWGHRSGSPAGSPWADMLDSAPRRRSRTAGQVPAAAPRRAHVRRGPRRHRAPGRRCSDPPAGKRGAVRAGASRGPPPILVGLPGGPIGGTT